MLKNYFVTYALDVIALIFLYVLLRGSNILSGNRKKPFLCGILLAIAIIFSEAGTILANDAYAGLRGLNIVCNVLGFALTPMVPIALLYISEVKSIHSYRLLLLPTLLNAAAAVLSPFFGLIFFVDPNNHYERGSIFFVFVAVCIFNLILLVVSASRTVKIYRYPIKGKLIALALFAAAGTSVQLLFPSVYSSWHCVVLSLFLYFLLMSEFDSSFDTLTGLYNRAAFEKIAKRMANRKAFSIIALDINDFKRINDTYGHDYGDTVLKTVASVFRRSLDRRYICFRIGGDEFYILGKETDNEKIESQLASITKALIKERENDGRLPTIAYGYRVFSGNVPMDFHSILKEADERMYNFKKRQKDIGSPENKKSSEMKTSEDD